MEILAKGKYVRVSPKKARAIANLIRGKNASESVVMLSSMPQSGAAAIKKVLVSSMANAENNFNLDKKELIISAITVNAGPVLKRFQPRAKGSASEIKKRTSHIEVVVSGVIKSKTSKNDEKQLKAKKEVVTDEESHKVEIERPTEKSVYTTTPKEMGKKMFRRKTG
jgi:large subunit ribosomal protein L22